MSQNEARMSMPNLLLRAEGFGLFAASIALYATLNYNGWVFLALLLAPDLSMIGYLRTPRTGAIAYNAVHNQVTPLVLFTIALVTGWTLGAMLALILFAHIGMDRTVGYGLKYSTKFKDTHLNRL